MTPSSNATSTVLPFVAGSDLQPSELREIHNPARITEVVGEVGAASADDITGAVAAAHEARTAWARHTPSERAELFLLAADAIEQDLADAAPGMVREHGKVRWEAEKDVNSAPRILRYYAEVLAKFPFKWTEADDRGTIVHHRRPFGVVGIIAPWNSPIPLCFLMAIPALAAGNTVVIKPAIEVPLTVMRALRALGRVLPDGVLNALPADGPGPGTALVTDSRVAKVSFTGSTATGAAILRSCSDQIKNATMELGGNDPAVVLPDCPITDSLVDELVKGVFTTSGQVCYNVKRIYVHASLQEEFRNRFIDAANQLVVGDGLEDGVTTGPLATAAQHERVRELLQSTAADGATMTAVGRRHSPDSWSDGLFVQPTVVTDIDHDAPLVAEEQFGPVVPILPYQDIDEAIERVNGTSFGLGASLWSPDVDRAMELAAEFEAGTVFVNVHRVGASDVSMPFGGCKESGIGRTHGQVAVEESTELQVFAHRPTFSTFNPSPDS